MPKWISYLKVRGSFASVGLPIPRFLAQQTYEWDNANQQWASKTHYPMGELKPERTDSWEVGLTARFLRHFNVDLSLYTAKTYNQTFDRHFAVVGLFHDVHSDGIGTQQRYRTFGGLFERMG